MWIVYAFLAALTAALVAIFAKVGLRDMDTTIATTLRSLIMAVFLVTTSALLGKFTTFSPAAVSAKEWAMLTLAGVAGALSWLFYFLALRGGSASAVVAIDRLSILFVIVIAALLLGETANWRTVSGAALMVVGAVMIALPGEQFARLWQQAIALVK
jgi:transporter family protein